MKTPITTIIITSAMVWLASLNMAAAQERYDSHEMGESGLMITFPATPVKLVTQIMASAPAHPAGAATTLERRDIHELPESGLTVTFPAIQGAMAAAHTSTAESGGNQEIQAIGAPWHRVIGYELPESGAIIVFPAKKQDPLSKDAIAATQD